MGERRVAIGRAPVPGSRTTAPGAPRRRRACAPSQTRSPPPIRRRSSSRVATSTDPPSAPRWLRSQRTVATSIRFLQQRRPGRQERARSGSTRCSWRGRARAPIVRAVVGLARCRACVRPPAGRAQISAPLRCARAVGRRTLNEGGRPMPDDRLPKDELGREPGLAGGPGPNPPGFGDGTPRILEDGSPVRPPAGAVRPRVEEVADRGGGAGEAATRATSRSASRPRRRPLSARCRACAASGRASSGKPAASGPRERPSPTSASRARTSASLPGSVGSGCGGSGLSGSSRTSSGRSAAWISLPAAVAAQRSITLRSSRTLPGHEYACRTRSAPAESDRPERPTCDSASRRNASASEVEVARLSRRGGTAIVRTLRRK